MTHSNILFDIRHYTDEMAAPNTMFGIARTTLGAHRHRLRIVLWPARCALPGSYSPSSPPNTCYTASRQP
jgi:hypothetical protein